MGVKKDEFCLLTAALLDPEKNHETVLRMLAGMKEKTEPPIRYVICGDGPHRRVLEELTRKWGLEDQVIFLGSAQIWRCSCRGQMCSCSHL